MLPLHIYQQSNQEKILLPGDYFFFLKTFAYIKLYLPPTVPRTNNMLLCISNSSYIRLQHRNSYIMLILVKSGHEMTHHIQLALQLMNYCILYLYLVASIKKKSMEKKIHPEIKASFMLINRAMPMVSFSFFTEERSH